VAAMLTEGPPAVAQTNRGAIAGTVVDATGGVLPGATVTIVNAGTSEQRSLTTSASGTYSATNLEPVTYRVVVDLAGFKKSVTDGVKVDTAATATVNVRLETGGLETQVRVTAEAPLLNAGSGTIGENRTER